MFVSKLALPRRTFLRGVGAAVALPLLDSMFPAFTPLARAQARPRTRFGAIYIPNGAIMEQWIPEIVGPGFDIKPILQPIESYKDQLVLVTNLTRSHPGSQVGDHAVSAAGFLTGVWPKRTEAEDVLANTSVDQIVAQQIGQDTPFPSIEVATEDFTGYVGACSPGFNCVYLNTVTWSSPSTPLPMDINPRVVFERMFGGDRATPEERRARLEKNTSILDAVAQSARELSAQLGARDRTRMNDYMENVREIERRIVTAEQQRDETGIDAPPTPVGIPENWEEHVTLMFDLMHLAYQGNLTRVTSFMMARELSTLSYPQIGVADGHHPVSHNNNIPEQVAKKIKVDIYHLDLFSQFLDKMQATPDGDGNLLDHSLFLYGSGMTNGNQHDHENLPTLLVGGGAGKHRQRVAVIGRRVIHTHGLRQIPTANDRNRRKARALSRVVSVRAEANYRSDLLTNR